MKRPPSAWLAFLVAFAIGAAGVFLLVWTLANGPTGAGATRLDLLAPDVWVAGQIEADDVATLRERGIQLIVALRPDGEEPDQPSSTAIGYSAHTAGIDFAYVPVPKEGIPDEVVDRLLAALKDENRPVLLYCRSGRRAARAWALAEASREGGLDLDRIRIALDGVGQPSDDLEERIQLRTKARKPNRVSNS